MILIWIGVYPLKLQIPSSIQCRPSHQSHMICLQFHILQSIVNFLPKLLNFFREQHKELIVQGKFVLDDNNPMYTNDSCFKHLLLCLDLYSNQLFFFILTSLKKLLKTKADAFLSNDYYESDLAWMELVSISLFDHT